MPIEPYSVCPGGTGKKVKFCCPDLVQELDKVQRMLEGDQPAACLDYLRKLDEKYPGRACLQSMRVPLEDTVGDREAAEATLAAFLKDHPDSAVALAEKALQLAGSGEPLGGIAWLQRAIVACSQEMPSQVYGAIGQLALALLSAGEFVPAYAHLQLQVGFSQGRDERAVAALLQVESSPQVPVLLKDIRALDDAPESASWRPAFHKGFVEARRGHWQLAADAWAALSKQAADAPVLWRNMATVYSYLGSYAKAVEALRKLASLDVPLDEAVQAEALAQLLSKDETQGPVDHISVAFPIGSAESAQEKLAADRRFERLPLDTRMWTVESEPPPRAAFSILDRPLPASGKELTREQVPNQLGQLLLFGKQTDREARLELLLYRPELPAAQRILQEALGEALPPPTEEKILGHLGQVEHALSWHWRLPDDTPEETRLTLQRDERQSLLLKRWPELAQPIFGGRTPLQAAGEPRYRIALLGAIWLLELSDADAALDTYNELRRKLNLQQLSDVDPAGLDIKRIPIGRLARLKVESLDDEQLKLAFNRAMVASFTLALQRLAPEVLKRPNLPAAEYKLAAYRQMVRLAATTDEALRLIDDARKLAEANKQSSGPWDLSELSIRIQRDEAEAVLRLIDHIQRHHAREPGVAEALVQLLVQTGLIGPDGRLAIGTPAPSAAASPLVVPGAAAEPGKLWTPDAPQPSGEKKSALWLPE
jgi:tetratricopeptide (TPR) repeat protein